RTVHYRQHEVELRELSATHMSAHDGATLVSLEKGKVVFNPDGSFWVELINLLGNPTVPDRDFIRALPPALGKGCTSLRIERPVSLLIANLAVAVPAERESPPQIRWDGGVRFKDATLVAGVPFERVNGLIWSHGEHRGVLGNVRGNLDFLEATVFGQTLRGLHSQVLVDAREPDVLVLPNLEAHLYGGEVGGEVRVDFGPLLRYEAHLTALQIQLEELSRANHFGPNPPENGLVSAHLHLKGEGSDLSGLKGSGSIDVP